jgi:DNA-binding transcriptional LysR family regulator
VNLVRLQYFSAIASAGTITAAAAELHVAQPALSRQLQQLERELGLTLFQRDGRRLVLTAAGRALVPLVEDLLARTRQFENATGDIATGTVRRLVLASPDTSIAEIVAPFLATMTSADPLIRVRRELPHHIHDALRRGADLVISTEPPVSTLAWVPLAAPALRAYFAPTHEWASSGRTHVTPADLVGQNLLLPPAEFMTRKLLDHAVVRAGLAYATVEECPVARVIQAQAAAGFGVGVLTEPPTFNVRTLPVVDGDEPLALRIHAAWDPAHHAASVIRSVVERMAEHTNASAL